MPSSVNGIGTTYYGKRNLETETGVCEFCKNQTTLSTYETTHFFIVLFIPIIPLGKKQIIDDCGVCRRHRVLPAAEWQRIREEAIESSSSQLADKMDDPKAAIEHLQTLTAFRQMDEARDLAVAIEGTHANDFDVQFFLGAWNEKYGQAEVADRCFDKAFDLDPKNPAAVRAKAMGLMEKGQFDEAKVMLQPLAPPSQYFDPGVFYQLGIGFQSQERHADAMEQFKLVSANAPELGRDKTFRKTVKKSEKATGVSSASILPSESIFSKSGFWWVLGTIALAGALIGGTIWTGQNRTVHVVNGNQAPITVSIDGGEQVTIPASSRRKVTLAEGSHEVEIVSPNIGIPKKQFEMSSSIWTRFFNSPCFVLDPTETAGIVWEETVYSENPNDEGDFDIKVGQTMTQFDDVDYAFQNFPDSIEVDSRSSRVTKTRVSFESLPPQALISDVVPNLSNDKRLQILETHLQITPDSIEDWSIYYTAGEMYDKLDRCIAFMEPKLDARPVNVELHRAYQQAILDSKDKEPELRARYKKYLDEDPKNPDLIYLNGRMCETASESNAMFEKALAIEPEHTFALNATAFNLMASGDFKQASKNFQRLVTLSPDSEIYRAEYIESLFAAKNYQTLNSVLRKIPPESISIFEAKANLLKATNAQRKYPNLLTTYRGLNQSRHALNLAEIHLAYLKGDMTKLQDKVSNLVLPFERSYYQLEADIETAKVDKSDGRLEGLPPQVKDQYIPLIAVVESQNGDKAKGKKRWNEFLTDLDSRGEHEIVRLARQAQTKDISIEEFWQVSMRPSRKRLFATAMLEFSETKNADLKAALKKLNFDMGFPHNFIKKILR